MTITPAGLVRASGLCAAAAGLIFVGVQVGHPPTELASVDSTEWVVRSAAKVVMSALALVGITGLYARQVRESGVLGLIGYLTFSIAYLLLLPVEVIAAFVLPELDVVAPAFVSDLLVTAFGGSPAGDLGLLPTYLAVAGLFFLVGGLVFGIALFRAGIVARWAAALLSLGALGTAALAVLPDSFNRPAAVPVGIAFMGLGLSLWRDRRTESSAPGTIAVASAPAPVR